MECVGDLIFVAMSEEANRENYDVNFLINPLLAGERALTSSELDAGQRALSDCSK
jgi:hypothetical protein